MPNVNTTHMLNSDRLSPNEKTALRELVERGKDNWSSSEERFVEDCWAHVNSDTTPLGDR